MNNMQHALSFRPLRSSDGLRCRPVQALGAIFLGLASLAYSVTSQAADEPENVKVVRQYLDAWNGGRTDAMEKVLDSNVVYFNTSNEASRTGPQAITEVSQFLMKILPDGKMKIRSQPVASGDGVAIEWEFTATKNSNGGTSPSSSTISYFGASFFRVSNGKIVYASDYYNHNTMQKQLQQ
ncbi:nuclear transport factor 2 family protein [Pseudomonas aeruginosa]|uniref:nuclear transport factor 2 family protein n=1 Tax=Pseudomonas aeruginosa TaxID=287 RepID=UPI0004F32751|nr:ester cyclase [Pseudomonas aeruginosa]